MNKETRIRGHESSTGKIFFNHSRIPNELVDEYDCKEDAGVEREIDMRCEEDLGIDIRNPTATLRTFIHKKEILTFCRTR